MAGTTASLLPGGVPVVNAGQGPLGLVTCSGSVWCEAHLEEVHTLASVQSLVHVVCWLLVETLGTAEHTGGLSWLEAKEEGRFSMISMGKRQGQGGPCAAPPRARAGTH